MSGAHPIVMIGAAAALLMASALQMVRDRTYPMVTAQPDRFLYLTSPGLLGRMVLGFDVLAADVYWIRAIQHYGGDRLGLSGARTRYELLYPLLDITTTLDPHFNIAYRFGAIFLSEPYPGGSGRPDLAIALLKKGIATRPTKWEYYHDIGFTHYWSLGDHQAAAEWFRRAAAQPNAPEWLLPIAASMLAEGKDRASARYIWTQLLHAEDDWVRKRAQRALVQLLAMDEMEKLAKTIASKPPPPGAYSWMALARAGVLPGMPTDPTGTPYDIHPTTGAITVAQTSPLYPMPRGLRR